MRLSGGRGHGGGALGGLGGSKRGAGREESDEAGETHFECGLLGKDCNAS